MNCCISCNNDTQIAKRLTILDDSTKDMERDNAKIINYDNSSMNAKNGMIKESRLEDLWRDINDHLDTKDLKELNTRILQLTEERRVIK